MRMSIMRPGGRWDGEEKREKGEERGIGSIQLEALYTAWHPGSILVAIVRTLEGALGHLRTGNKLVLFLFFAIAVFP